MNRFFSVAALTLSFLMLAGLAGLTGCKSNPKIETIDTKLGQSQTAGGLTIGVNADDRLMYQKKVDIVNEMVQVEDEVRALSDKVYGTPEYNSKGLYGKAMACRKKKAMKTGNFDSIPNHTPVIEEDQVKVGQEEHSKKLIALTEENLQVRLTRFREYKKTLYSRQEELEGYIEQCEVGTK
jgi:hypothetical protein